MGTTYHIQERFLGVFWKGVVIKEISALGMLTIPLVYTNLVSARKALNNLNKGTVQINSYTIRNIYY